MRRGVKGFWGRVFQDVDIQVIAERDSSRVYSVALVLHSLEFVGRMTVSVDHEYDANHGLRYEVTKSSKYVTDGDLKDLPFFQRINWLSTTIIFTPLIAFILGMFFVELKWQTLLLAIAQYILSGLGITAGYHRLWSHKSYKAGMFLQLVLACWGAAAFEGSIRWWCRNHRAHHRYVDTDKDPYAVHKGFWYAHLGWMVFKQEKGRSGRVDITDLNEDKLIMWQHKNYLPIAIGFAFVLPVTLATFCWNDFWGGLVYACMGRMFIVHQATFCVNSLAHTLGSQTYSTEHTSYDHVITALVTFGEGYHNYHHEFPHDYRNGIRWYQFDPTKWVIRFSNLFGMTSSLLVFPDNEIKKARVQVKQQQLDQQKKEIDWGRPVETLDEMTWQDVRRRTEEGEILVVIENIVYKVDEFLAHHPGGPQILKFWKGRDASLAFNGETYNHSKAARNLLMNFRLAKLVEKLE
eukprot:CAMPEP_0113954600 /NCGR_PEP_ID=MMETSP0011_2-20120614/677_1 /TAXON_ID=101924 /ORGANISM="Rhodosorus marinus" /LENGTH=462 /DNA_ID=CAMNT_0000963815 /DNA_START=542 /DNA_END=1930 /DNA_ORIENTATION=+ /assembly_acc=CAM_ASM_000156